MTAKVADAQYYALGGSTVNLLYYALSGITVCHTLYIHRSPDLQVADRNFDEWVLSVLKAYCNPKYSKNRFGQ